MNKIAVLCSLLLVLLWACNETATGGQETASGTEAPAAGTPAMSGSDAYTITIVKDSIPSPRKEMRGTLGEATVTVTYGSPSIKGRPLWGDLVPYGEVWRTGANEATTFSVSKDVTIEGQTLPAGTYGLFTIPGEGDWTIIFNTTAEQWGAYEYDEAADALRVKVVPSATETSSETLEFMIEGDKVVMHWGQIMVPFAVAG